MPVTPCLRVTDYERAKAFYAAGLGFAVDWEHRFGPGFPVFMQVTRGDLTFYLSEHAGDCQPGGLLYFYVPDVDAWHAELTGRGVAADGPPQDQPWGNRDFTVRDPFGNTICIATRFRPR